MNNIKVGYYRVNITCENKNFRKLFTFSKKNTYTDRSLFHAMKHQKEFNIKIELDQSLKYNCYLYDDSCLESGKKLFGLWFKYVSELKAAFPKNGLVKFLGSSLHGQISARQYITLTEEEIDTQKLDIGTTQNNRYFVKEINFFGKNRDIKKYKLIDTTKDRCFNIRLKAFLTAYVRNKTARLCTGHIYFGKKAEQNVLHNLDDIVRVCVDSVAFRKEMPHLNNIEDLKLESKSTGLIKWFRYDKYKNKSTGKFHGKFNDDERYEDDEDDE